MIRAVLRRLPWPVVLLIAIGVAGFVQSGGGLDRFDFDGRPAAIPFPVPVYSIEATSGSHQASLLNLPLGQPGVAQVPIPVDVDGDLLPDVLVATNLIHVDGLFNNPPQIGQIVAPNIQVLRMPTAPVLGQSSPPLRIASKITLTDLEGEEPPTILRVGYDTGVGGSIPMSFKAVVGGITELFDPLEIVVDTTGGILGLHTGLEEYLPTSVADPYQGPLTLIGGISSGADDTAFDFAFKPFPRAARVSYAADDEGQHFAYAHSFPDEVDLNAKIKLTGAEGVTDIETRVDRLPRSLALDLQTGESDGRIGYRDDADGRRPDVGVALHRRAPGQPPMHARLDLEALPPEVTAAWSMPKDGPIDLVVDAPGPGIGAVDAEIVNYDGAPTAFTPIVPTERQYVDFQGVVDGQQLIRARVDRVRALDLTLADGVIDASADIGDGELPLQLHYLRHDAATDRVEANATVAPLPLEFDAVVRTDSRQGAPLPLDLTYGASETAHVDGRVEIRDADRPTERCGEGDTTCADIAVRHLPTELSARIRRAGPDMRVELATTPRQGSLQPDAFADVVMGPIELEAPDPLIASVDLLGIPTHATVRLVKEPEASPSRVEFHGCDWVVAEDGVGGACRPGTGSGTPGGTSIEPADIGEVRFDVRNRLERPTDLPQHRSSYDQFATYSALGEAYEVTGRVLQVEEVQFATRGTKEGSLTGLRAQLGNGVRPLQTIIDMRRVDLDKDDPNNPLTSLSVDSLVDPLPAELDVCIRSQALPPGEPLAPFTADCQTEASAGRMAVAYDAYGARPHVRSDVEMVEHDVELADPDDVPNPPRGDSTMKASIDIDRLPGHLTSLITSPPDEQPAGEEPVPFELDYDAGDGGSVNADVAIELLEDDLTCADARDTLAAGLDALCFSGRIANLPPHLDVYYQKLDTLTPEQRVQHADNFRISSSGGTDDIDVNQLRLETVSSTVEPGDTAPTVSRLLAGGTITGMPTSLEGRIDMPIGFELRTPADSPIEQIDFQARNFIAPDPFEDVPDRPDFVPATSAAQQQVTFQQRGELFRVAATDITNVRHVGYSPSIGTEIDPATGDPVELDAKQVFLDFGDGEPLRLFIDLEKAPPADEVPDLSRTIVDVTLDDVPRGISACFRGPRETAGTPVEAIPFCDDPTVDPERSTFRFTGTSGVDTSGLDVYGFLRLSSQAGLDVTSARFEVTNVPFTLQGILGDGAVKVNGFEQNGTTPDGIDRIAFEVANADIDDPGYDQPYPWGIPLPALPLPAFATLQPGVTQYVQGNLVGDDFHVRGDVGVVEGSGQAGADLHTLDVNKLEPENPGEAKCAPATSGGSGYLPSDYPDYPAVAAAHPDTSEPTAYTCVTALFEPVNGGGGGNAASPLGLHLNVQKENGDVIEVRNAGLTRIPNEIRAVLSEAPELDREGRFRPVCGPVGAEEDPDEEEENPDEAGVDPQEFAARAPVGCVPPLLRVDTSGDAHLYGVVTMGRRGDLDRLLAEQPKFDVGTLDFNAAPTPTGGWTDWGPGSEGIRLRLGTFDGAPSTCGAASSDSRTAIQASLRIEVPRSLTIDPLQTWDQLEVGHNGQSCRKADDLKLRFVIRDANGVRNDDTELAALIHDFRKGSQIVLTRPDDGLGDSENGRGLIVPGELAVSLQTREVAIEHDVRLDIQARNFIQLDGRANGPVNLRLRQMSWALATNGTFIDVPAHTRALDASIRNAPSYASEATAGPSFRAQVELLNQASDSNPCTFFLCVEADARLGTISADLDFGQARRLLGVVNIDSPQVGAQFQGFDAINGGNPAEFSGKVHLAFRPFDLIVHAGIPVVGSFDMKLDSNLTIDVVIDRATDFTARSNLLRIVADHNGPGEGSRIDVAFDPSFLLATVHSIFGALIGNPLLYIATWLPVPAPEVGENAILAFLPCPNAPDFDGLGVNTIPIGSGDDVNLFAAIQGDPRFITHGVLKLSLGLFEKLLFAAFCALPADLPLIGNGHPGPPFSVPTHPIDQAVANDATSPTPDPPPDLVVESGEVRDDLCGDRTFATVTVRSGGTLRPATVAGPTCLEADIGRLAINVPHVPGNDDLGTVEIAGRLEAAAGSNKKLTVTASDIEITSTGIVQASAGRVSLAAHETILVDGQVLADGVIGSPIFGPGSDANTGGSGSSHGGQGGQGGGPNFLPPPTYGDESLEVASTGPDSGEVPSEGGARGADTGGPDNPGAGGGTLSLTADHVVINGTVSADGLAASGNSPGQCSAPAEGGNPATPNQSTPGAGGGSGGGLVLAGRVVTVGAGGSVSAIGGRGGDSFGAGGGGGGGGIAKVVAGLYVGAPPAVGGGGAGLGRCDHDFSDGGAGEGGLLVEQRTPTSKVDEMIQIPFWHRSPGLEVPIRAASGSSAGDRMQVVLCAIVRPPEAVLQNDPNFTFGLFMPHDAPGFSTPFGQPCGILGPLGTYQLATVSLEASQTTSSIAIPADSPIHTQSGYAGFYTRTFEPGALGNPANDCFVTNDFVSGTGPLGIEFENDGVLYDLFDCDIEPLGTTPDAVIGLDNTAPRITNAEAIPFGGALFGVLPYVNGNHAPLDIRADDIVPPGDPHQFTLSGLNGTAECSNDAEGGDDPNATFEDCGIGVVHWPLDGVEAGLRRIVVRVTDHAGNWATDDIYVMVDADGPTSALEIGLPPGQNGWVHDRPTLRITDLVDPEYPNPFLDSPFPLPPPLNEPQVPGSGFGEKPVKWWFDAATDEGVEPVVCSPACDVPAAAIPPFGFHQLRWYATDAVGNREPVQVHDVRIDGLPPRSEAITVPSAPDGANGWYTRPPLVTFSAIDQPGGSGMRNAPGDAVQDAGVYYSVTTDGVPTVTNQRFTAPFALGPGQHDVCFFARDVAGNSENQHCTPQRIKVDDVAPTVELRTTPLTPDGAGGWFVTVPTAEAIGADATSGFDPAIDRNDLCSTRPGPVLPTPGPRPSGVCLSVDGAPFQPVPGSGMPVTLGEGEHVLRAFAVDASGQRSRIERRPVLVDRSTPVSTARLVPPDPARNGWWRTRPTLVLRATDGAQNAGVGTLEYRLGTSGPFTAYTGPITLPTGTTTVEHRAVDRAGRSEAVRRLVVPVDVAPPVVRATTPTPAIFLRILNILTGLLGLPPMNANLNWTVSDDQSRQVQVTVLVHNVTGAVVRVLDAGLVTVTPGVTRSGTVVWDGRDLTLTGLVPIGAYYYRVVAVDEAGNVAHSGESKPMQIKLG